MQGKLIGILSIIALIVTLLSILTWFYRHNMSMSINSIQNQSSVINNIEQTESTKTNEARDKQILIQPSEGQSIKTFSLVAEEASLEIKKGLFIPVWTYGKTVPGSEIRVTEGDFVRVELKNNLKFPITIHWHGYPVISAMDGLPGITQDAIKPGESFTYEFSADVIGTYWYHSHQESSTQVDKGLYGALIVEPKNQTPIDKEFTLIFDEWMENYVEEMDNMSEDGSNDEMDMGNMSMSNSNTMSSTNGTDLVAAEEEMMKNLYNIFTVNGKSGELISPLDVEQGDIVKLRLINAGYRTHGIHLPGQVIKVVSTDGQEIAGATEFKDQIILIAPGERYDIEFKIESDKSFIIDAHDTNLFNDQIKIPVNVVGSSNKSSPEETNAKLPIFDLSKYGEPKQEKFTQDQKYDIDQYIELNTDTNSGSIKYTINRKVFNELPPLTIQTADSIKLTYENKSTIDHPMHLHGHFFQILARNGVAFSGTIIKDTLLVKPGEKYEIAFKADNPGLWVQHCHELHHAAGGMMQSVIYSDYKTNYIPNPNDTFNKVE